MQSELRGVYVPLITPFASGGSIAADAIVALVHRYADAGVAGIVTLGTTGEPATLSPDEKQRVIDVTAAACRERQLELIVGAGSNSTAATIGAIEAVAATPGLRAVLIVAPYYVRPSEAGIVAHFRAIAEATSVPVVVYNIPARTGRNMSASTILEVAALPNVIGLKQAVGALDEDTLRVLAEAPASLSVLSGDDAYILPTVLMGGQGAIAASAHLCTDRFVAMVECGLSGKIDDARQHAEALLPVVAAGFAEPNPAVFKGVLHALGAIPTPDVRLPLVPASAASVQRACDAVIAAGG
ncbi:MAG: 4-hydroxy-tetrahydrodipicolinate synthase [Acidimicrobiia bacterium]